MSMVKTQHAARVTGPIAYVAPGGKKGHIPRGPCLVEQLSDECVDIVWGASGQRSAALPVDAVAAAEKQGHLVLLD